jgi:hypothetical protein
MSPMTLTLCVLPPYLQFWQITCYFFSFLVMGTTMGIFSITFRSLLIVATLLNKCFKVKKTAAILGMNKLHSILRASIP